MATTTKKYDLDLSRLGDEQLVVMAQECGFRPAANELLRRHHPRMGRLIAYQARQTPLTAHDVEDAQQNAVFALVEAIAGYNTLEMVKPGGCRFRTYGRLVTLRRFWNFVKQTHRRQKRYHWLAQVDPWVPCFRGPTGDLRDCRKSHGAAKACHPISVSQCPADAAARQEILARLSRVLERLAEKKRALWQQLAAGKKLRQIAGELGISYDAVKRQRRKLLAHLRIAIWHWTEPAEIEERG